MAKGPPSKFSNSGRILSQLCLVRWKSINKVCALSGAVIIILFLLVYYTGTSSVKQDAFDQQVPFSGTYATAKSSTEATGSSGRTLSTKPHQEKSSASKYAVKTSTCKIPEMNPFDPSLSDFLQPDSGYPHDCKGSHKKWTYINGTLLSVNVSAVHGSGYSLSSIYCCYRIIERVEQPLSDYDMNAENYIKYSEKCYPVHNTTVQIDAEYIRVHCVSKLPPLYNDVVYRDFFAIAQPSADRLVFKKLNEWRRKAEKVPRPSSIPNVALIVIDNNSRMNSHRYLTKTLEYFKSIGAVEMLGYTKVAENSYPNAIPLLTGYTAKQLEPICHSSPTEAFDNCPLIWKVFEELNYITVNAEDSPYLGAFNYLKSGFLRKPADYYLRTLMLAVMTYLPRADYYHTDCIGRQMTDEFLFKYTLDLVQMATSHSAPMFIYSWVTTLAHHNYNNIQFADNSIASFFRSLINATNDNTIFFFMGDHGQRYGPIRETTQGWYEDKLPMQWVYLPKRIDAAYPDWKKNLMKNSGRLTSHFDLYKTLLHILKTFHPGAPEVKKIVSNANHQFGQSLFDEVPENRTCDDAGITVNFCACSKPKPVDITDSKIIRAAKVSVKHLKSKLPLDKCEEPSLKSILSASFLDLPGKPVYVITIATEPGDFLFEVNVEEYENEQFVINTDLLRMNKISRPANCVTDALLERYCYCK